ncbi:MAG TPA: VOC family protein [Terriglobales bacterium]|nr:VOC family protein [Terriglobales bacterium]
MKTSPIPPGYHTVTPYLTVANARAEIEFLKRAFGAQTTETLSEESDGTIRHAELKIGDSMLMLGQARDQWTPRPTGFYLYVEDCDAWYKRAMAAGAKSLMEPADQFYGDRNAGVEDPEGNYWWIGTRVEDLSPDELKRRAQAAFTQSK